MDANKNNLPYRLIYELGNAFASRLELDDLIGLVVKKCREVFNAEGVSVLLLDEEREEFYFPYFSDLDPTVAQRLMEMRFHVSKGVAGAVLRTGRSARVDRVASDPDFYSEVDKFTGFQTRSIVAALLVAGQTRLGVIEVVNPIGMETFTDDHLALLEALAESIALAVHNAHKVAKLKASAENLRTEVGMLRRDLAKHEISAEIIGTSPEMAEVFRLMNNAAASSISVLLEGETGTGKDLVARAIHRMSGRADKAFLAVNCAALSEHLLESELFGHRRGAFTGAVANQPGLFRAANGGIIFLDEIGEMPLAMQPSLLRVLQDGEIMSVGDTRPERVDVRVFSATNRDLRAAVGGGNFSRRSLLSARCVSDSAAAAAGSAPRHSSARGSFSVDRKRTSQKGYPRIRSGRARNPSALRLAGQHPRAAKRDRTRDRADSQRRDHQVRATFAACADANACWRRKPADAIARLLAK